MNRMQFLLVKLAEEAAEISQIALKASQFGLEEKKDGQDLSNRERVHAELNDLMGIVTMLNQETHFDYACCPDAVANKIQRVNIYFNYSASLGMVKR